jgi:ribonucleotide reductase beta subunit family protein with ferritin-like domain
MNNNDEPLLRDSSERYTLFPIQYDDIYQMYKRQVDSFWRPEEVDLSRDLNDWATLTDDERHFISMTLAFFAGSDGLVMENISLRFLNDVKVAEARSFYAFQSAMESIHSEMYSILIETYIKDTAEKNKLFNAIDNFPCITTKARWAEKWIGDDDASFASRLVAFACVEGIFFSSSFASIYWIKKRGLMPGLTLSNEFISRDEALHTEFAIILYNKLNNRISKECATEIIRDATEIEKSFITDSLPCRLIGMNSKLMTQYVEFVADRLCVQLGYDKIYGSHNPFDFMELISVETKTNFFERTNSEYALTNCKKDDTIFELNTDF